MKTANPEVFGAPDCVRHQTVMEMFTEHCLPTTEANSLLTSNGEPLSWRLEIFEKLKVEKLEAS